MDHLYVVHVAMQCSWSEPCRLHKAVCIFQIDRKSASDLVELARYSYNKWVKDLEDRMDTLRGVFHEYIALHAGDLVLYTVFMNFVAEGGQFASDFVRFAVQRMQYCKYVTIKIAVLISMPCIYVNYTSLLK